MRAIKIASTHGRQSVQHATHQLTPCRTETDTTLRLQTFCSRKKFLTSGNNTPASQPCRTCRDRLITPFRLTHQMCSALGLRTPRIPRFAPATRGVLSQTVDAPHQHLRARRRLRSLCSLRLVSSLRDVARHARQDGLQNDLFSEV